MIGYSAQTEAQLRFDRKLVMQSERVKLTDMRELLAFSTEDVLIWKLRLQNLAERKCGYSVCNVEIDNGKRDTEIKLRS